MALPTFSNHGPNRARVLADQWARQREREAQRRQQWELNAQYLRQESVRCQKQAVWSSQESYKQSMGAYHKERLKEEKRLSLEQRRDRLRLLLEEERKQLEAELQEALSHRRTPSSHLRTKELLAEREGRRKKIAQELLKEHRRNDSEKHESVLHKDQVVGQQEVDERQQQQEEMRCLERTRQQREERRAEERRRAEELRKQMEELKLREAEATRLKKVQEALLVQQWELEKMEEERRQLVERRRKCEIGHLLIRQYRAQLRRRAQQVQEELEADRRILAALLEGEEEEEGEESSRRELEVADAAWMKRVIEEQLQLERDREAELDFLQRADAQHAWEKREQEWEKERKARERLMHEVLVGRQKQLEQKMQRNRGAQEESLRRREELIQQLEMEHEPKRREAEEIRDQEDREDESTWDIPTEVNQGHQEVPRRAAWT